MYTCICTMYDMYHHVIHIIVLVFIHRLFLGQPRRQVSHTCTANALPATHVPYTHSMWSSAISPQVGGGSAAEGVEVALDPSELDLDAATMTARWVATPHSLSPLWVVTFEPLLGLKVTTHSSLNRAWALGRRVYSMFLHHKLKEEPSINMCTSLAVYTVLSSSVFLCLCRYEEQLKETTLQKEDLSDMVAEHAAKQKVQSHPLISLFIPIPLYPIPRTPIPCSPYPEEEESCHWLQ